MSSTLFSPIETPLETKSFERVQYAGDHSENGSADGDGEVLNSHVLQEPMGFQIPHTYHNCQIQMEQFPREQGTHLSPLFIPVHLERIPELTTDIRLSVMAGSLPSVFPYSPFKKYLPFSSAPHYMAATPCREALFTRDCGVDHLVETPAFHDFAQYRNIMHSSQPNYHTYVTGVHMAPRPVPGSYSRNYVGTPDLSFRQVPGSCSRNYYVGTPDCFGQRLVAVSPETAFHDRTILGRPRPLMGPEPVLTHQGSDENSAMAPEATTSRTSTQQLQLDQGFPLAYQIADSPSPPASRCGSPITVYEITDSPSPPASRCDSSSVYENTDPPSSPATRCDSSVYEITDPPSSSASRCGSPMDLEVAESPSPPESRCHEATAKPTIRTASARGRNKNTKPMKKKTSIKRGRKTSKPPGFGALNKRLQDKLGEGKPKRALTAYNIFFKDERAAILNEIAEEEERKRKDDDEKEWPKYMRTLTDGRCNTSASAGEHPKRMVLTASSSVGETTSEEIKISRRKKPHKKMGFAKMARTISARWKTVDPERLADCKRRASHEKLRYKAELAVYEEKHREALHATQGELESSVSPEAMKIYLESYAPGGTQSHVEPE